MFGSGPSEEIRLESKTVEQQPPDQRESQARFEDKIGDEKGAAEDGRKPGALLRFKRWLSEKL